MIVVHIVLGNVYRNIWKYYWSKKRVELETSTKTKIMLMIRKLKIMV